MERVAGLDLVGDDVVGVEAPAAGLTASVELPAADLLGDVVEGRPRTIRCPLPGGTATWNEPSSLLATIASKPSTMSSRRLHREELDAGPGHRPAGPLLGHLAADQHAAGEREVDLLLDGPLGPREFVLCGQVGLALGGKGTHAEVVARVGVDLEPALVVGAELGREHPAERAEAGPHGDHGVGIGRPVSAARTRPSMIVAGWRASETSFASSRSAAWRSNRCWAKRGSRTDRMT